jgi:hypothetical protein
MTESAIDGKVKFLYRSSNENLDEKWGEFVLLINDNDGAERELSLEREEMLKLAIELISASTIVSE